MNWRSAVLKNPDGRTTDGVLTSPAIKDIFEGGLRGRAIDSWMLPSQARHFFASWWRMHAERSRYILAAILHHAKCAHLVDTAFEKESEKFSTEDTNANQRLCFFKVGEGATDCGNFSSPQAKRGATYQSSPR